MADRETITIPAPIARPDETVEVLVHSVNGPSVWMRGKVESADYRFTGDVEPPGWWDYSVVVRFGLDHREFVVAPSDEEIRRVEGGA